MILVPNVEPLREANPCHKPAGTPDGGQFCSKDGGHSEIAAGRPWGATEDQFVAYHQTGHIPSDAYQDAESGKFDYIHRDKFKTLLGTRTINGQQVEIRVGVEEARYPKRVPERADREKLWDAYNAEARRLGTNVMSAGLDLGRDSAEYARLQRFEQAWLDAGERWERDANGDLVYLTPEEMRSEGLSPFIYTVAAFVGDKAVGYAGDEFGATGVYVSKTFQRHGLGQALLRAYLDKSGRLAKGKKLGQMTDAGVALTRALHRQLRREHSSGLREYNTCHDPKDGRFCAKEDAYDAYLGPPRIKLRNEITDAHSGQLDGVIYAHAGDRTVGRLLYTVYNNVVGISNITVAKDMRRKGIATQMLKQLRVEYPDSGINPGYRTEDGEPWWQAAKRVVRPARKVKPAKAPLWRGNRRGRWMLERREP